MTTSDHDPLDAVFKQAAETPESASDDFMARILADAQALQPSAPDLTSPPVSEPEEGLWSRMWQGLGGWSSFAGLATATAAGVWIGVDTPDMANGVLGLYFDTSAEITFFETDDGWNSVLEDSEI